MWLRGDDMRGCLAAVMATEISAPQGSWEHVEVAAPDGPLHVVCAAGVGAESFLTAASAATTGQLQQRLQGAGADRLEEEEFSARRIEARWPLYGIDFNDRNLPQEVARDLQAISFTKGCYLGQETIARIDGRACHPCAGPRPRR